MRSFFFLAQMVAPFAGLLGLALVVLGVKGDPPNFGLARWGAGLLVFGIAVRPRRGHPMSDLLGMHRDRPDRAGTRAVPPQAGPDAERPEAAEARAFLREFIKHNVAALSHEPGELPHHAMPARLVPLLPGEAGRGRSWIGGAPMLPERMAWPEAKGHPMLFVAQVALDELPEGIWGGLGPREGWLAFFMPSEGRFDEDMRVVHLTGPVSERAWPKVPNTFYFGYGGDRARETLAAAGLSVPPHPPRFPVAIDRHDGPLNGDRPRPSGEPLRDTVQIDYDPRSPAFRPFDRPTARALAQAAITGQRRGLKSVDDDIRSAERLLEGDGDAETRAWAKDLLALAREARTSRDGAIAALEDIDRELAARPEAAFSQGDAAATLAGIEAITVQNVLRLTGREIALSPRHSVLDDGWTKLGGRIPFEMLVAEALRTCPDRVPDAVRTRFEALWREDQDSEYVVMGGPVHTGFFYARARDPVFLLEVPSSDLVGWMFGDVSRLGVFIAPEDLAAGRLHKAWGDILN